MNELKLMAIKAKSRLLNKGIREIYSPLISEKKNLYKKEESFSNPSLELLSENERKRQILNHIKSKMI